MTKLKSLNRRRPTSKGTFIYGRSVQDEIFLGYSIYAIYINISIYIKMGYYIFKLKDCYLLCSSKISLTIN